MSEKTRAVDANGAAEKTVRPSRGKGFPLVPLPEAVRVVKRAGTHRREHTRAAFAGYMGHSTPNSGSFMRRLAALKDYGLVATEGDRVVLTDLGNSLAFPADDAAEREHIQKAFRNAAAFTQMVDLLPHGQPVGLATVANRAVSALGVAAASRTSFARSFAESAVFARVARDAGAEAIELVGGGADGADAEGHDVGVVAPPSMPAPPRSDQHMMPVAAPVWPVPGGQVAFEVHLDHPMPARAWAQIGEITGAIEKLVAVLSRPSDDAAGEIDSAS